jgi:ribosomal protein S21
MRKEKKGIVAVKVIKGDINRALKKYKRKVNDSGHLMELRERQTYTKPKTKRRKQKMDAIRRNDRDVLFEKWENGDNTITLFTKKKNKSNNSNKSEKKQEDLLAKYGLDRK